MTNEELRLEWSSSVADAKQAIDLLQAAKNGDDPETTDTVHFTADGL